MNENQQIARLQAQAGAWLKKAQDLQKKHENTDEPMPQEVRDELAGYLGKIDECTAQIKLVQQTVKAQAFLDAPAGPQAVQTGWRQAADGEGDVPVDPKSWRSIDVEVHLVNPNTGVVSSQKREMRYQVPLAVQKKGYASAFAAYLQRGYNELGPQDRKTLTEGVDSAGGFLVDEDYQTELIKKIATMATIRANARVAQTSRDIAKWPRVVYTTDDEYTSGVRLTWTGESPASATAHRVTDPVYGLYSIPVHTSMASMPISNDLIEDSAFDIVGLSSDMLAEAFALGENDAFLNGNGVARPMGMLTQVDGDGPASVASGDAATLTANGVVDLWGALPSQYETNAKWLFAKATEVVIRKLQDSQNRYLWPILPEVGNFGPAPRSLLGFPTMRDEFVPEIAANAYPIIFGDLRGYLVLDRVGLSIQRLSEIYAETNVTLLLARKRVGGQTVEPWRLKVQKIST